MTQRIGRWLMADDYGRHRWALSIFVTAAVVGLCLFAQLGGPPRRPALAAAQSAPPSVSASPTAPSAEGVAGSATPTAVPRSSPQPAPAPTQAAPVTPTPAGPVVSPAYYVGNTGGDGVYLRHTPRLSDKAGAWPDGAAMLGRGPRVTAGGVEWLNVKAPDGTTGWIPTQYLVTPVRQSTPGSGAGP